MVCVLLVEDDARIRSAVLRHVLRMIRSVSDVPVIVATARDDEAEIVATLNDGADDYVVKPYSGAQLAARIQAVWRRTGGDDQPTVLRIADLEIERRRRG